MGLGSAEDLIGSLSPVARHPKEPGEQTIPLRHR